MTVKCAPCRLSGRIKAVASKSEAHRMFICAALSDGVTQLAMEGGSADIEATQRCLARMGSVIEQRGGLINVTPALRRGHVVLDCGESGSTLRFLLPVVAALGMDAEIHGHGRLPARPLAPLIAAMQKNGARFHTGAAFPLELSGKLRSGVYELAGNVSSQFASGLMFALPLLAGDSVIKLLPPVESRSYIDMTAAALNKFGVAVHREGDNYYIKGNQRYHSPVRLSVGGDWSNSAFFLCAGAAGEGVTVTGLSADSSQGDKKLLDILARMGADISVQGDAVRVCGGKLTGTRIDASDMPDAVPALAVTAAMCTSGTTHIVNAGRLRFKESDRLAAMGKLLRATGANFTATADGFTIMGGARLGGGVLDGCSDHRIIMAGALASAACRDSVYLTGAEAVRKSYPNFFRDFNSLGGRAYVVDDGQ